MTEKGTLTDFEGSTVRINDIPMPAKPNVMQACRSVLKKKMEVDFTVEQIDGILTVTNIAPHQDKAAHEKAKAMGFGEPTPGPAPAAKQEEKKDCTSSGTPAPVQCTEVISAQQARPVAQPVPKNYSSDEMVLLRNVIAKDCTESEFKMMMYMAGVYGLDPLLKQIWAVKRNEKTPAIIFVGRDGMLAIAHRSGQFDGINSGVNYEKDAAGKELPRPVSAWCEIWRKDMTHSFKTEVRFDEYEQPIPMSGRPGLWQTKPSVMIIKVAESVCLRKAFVVSGVYDPDEISNGGA